MNDSVELILASASPRRRELIPFLGLPWKILAVDVDEDQIDHPDPAENVMHTAALKAEEAARRTADKAVVLAAASLARSAGESPEGPAGEVIRLLVVTCVIGFHGQVEEALSSLVVPIEPIGHCLGEVHEHDSQELFQVTAGNQHQARVVAAGAVGVKQIAGLVIDEGVGTLIVAVLGATQEELLDGQADD